jgi:hypothetical protein
MRGESGGGSRAQFLDPQLALSAALLAERERSATAEYGARKRQIFPLGVNRSRLDQAIRQLGVAAEISRTEGEADAVFVLKNMARKQPDRVEAALSAQVPVVTLRNDSLERLSEALLELFGSPGATGNTSHQGALQNDSGLRPPRDTASTS